MKASWAWVCCAGLAVPMSCKKDKDGPADPLRQTCQVRTLTDQTGKEHVKSTYYQSGKTATFTGESLAGATLSYEAGKAKTLTTGGFRYVYDSQGRLWYIFHDVKGADAYRYEFGYDDDSSANYTTLKSAYKSNRDWLLSSTAAFTYDDRRNPFQELAAIVPQLGTSGSYITATPNNPLSILLKDAKGVETLNTEYTYTYTYTPGNYPATRSSGNSTLTWEYKCE